MRAASVSRAWLRCSKAGGPRVFWLLRCTRGIAVAKADFCARVLVEDVHWARE